MPAAKSHRPLDRTSAMPLWAQLLDELTRRVEAGDFAAGVPGEHDLAQEYDVSRHTVREALRRMRDAGVLTSGRGRPTSVRAAMEQPLGSLYSLFREVEGRGMVQSSVVLAQDVVTDAEASAALGLASSTRLFHLERIRLADATPLAHDRVWLPASIAAPLMDADFSHAALYDELAVRCGVRVTGGHERIRAVVPAPQRRTQLDLPRGQACLAVERVGEADRRPIEYRLTLVRGDRWSVVANWTASGYAVTAVADPTPPR